MYILAQHSKLFPPMYNLITLFAVHLGKVSLKRYSKTMLLERLKLHISKTGIPAEAFINENKVTTIEFDTLLDKIHSYKYFNFPLLFEPNPETGNCLDLSDCVKLFKNYGSAYPFNEYDRTLFCHLNWFCADLCIERCKILEQSFNV